MKPDADYESAEATPEGSVCPDCGGTGVTHVEVRCGGCSGLLSPAHLPQCGLEPCPRGCPTPLDRADAALMVPARRLNLTPDNAGDGDRWEDPRDTRGGLTDEPAPSDTAPPEVPEPHGWTGHGHQCCRAHVYRGGRPALVARCGGPGLCTQCSRDAAQIHARPAQDGDAR